MDMQKHRFLYIHISVSREEGQAAGAVYRAMPSCLKLQYVVRENVTDLSEKYP